jgi:hypothetical protein
MLDVQKTSSQSLRRFARGKIVGSWSHSDNCLILAKSQMSHEREMRSTSQKPKILHFSRQILSLVAFSF